VNRIFTLIHKLEKRLFSRKVYKSRWFFVLKIILLFPLVLIRLLGRVRFNRPNNNSPIVLANIISGFSNLSFPNEQIENMALKRAAICSVCPAAQKSGLYSIIKDKRTKQIQGMKCDDCGCNLSAKVRSEHDYCPRGKW